MEWIYKKELICYKTAQYFTYTKSCNSVPVHVMKSYGGEKVQLRPFLNQVLAGSYETMHYPKLGARTYVVDWGTMLQARRSRIPFPIGPLA
jgi:hypothetical protein